MLPREDNTPTKAEIGMQISPAIVIISVDRLILEIKAIVPKYKSNRTMNLIIFFIPIFNPPIHRGFSGFPCT